MRKRKREKLARKHRADRALSRTMRYYLQNGTRTLTPKQRRRVLHKSKHEVQL